MNILDTPSMKRQLCPSLEYSPEQETFENCCFSGPCSYLHPLPTSCSFIHTVSTLLSGGGRQRSLPAWIILCFLITQAGEIIYKTLTFLSKGRPAATSCCCCKIPAPHPFTLHKAESGGTWMVLTIQSVFQAAKCLLILFVLVCKSGCNYDTEHIYYPVGERCKVWLNVMN